MGLCMTIVNDGYLLPCSGLRFSATDHSQAMPDPAGISQARTDHKNEPGMSVSAWQVLA